MSHTPKPMPCRRYASHAYNNRVLGKSNPYRTLMCMTRAGATYSPWVRTATPIAFHFSFCRTEKSAHLPVNLPPVRCHVHVCDTRIIQKRVRVLPRLLYNLRECLWKMVKEAPHSQTHARGRLSLKWRAVSLSNIHINCIYLYYFQQH